MKKILKKIAVYLLLIGLCLNSVTYTTKAAGATVTIALSSSSVSIGNTVTVTVTISGADDSVIYLTYDSSIIEYQSGSASGVATVGGGGGTLTLSGPSGSTSMSFTAKANGSTYVYTSGDDAYDLSTMTQVEVSHGGATITVETQDTTSEEPSNDDNDTPSSNDEDDDRSSNCYLASLDVSPGTLEPEFSYSNYEYTLRVEEDVTEIAISANTDDSKATTEVSGASSIKPGKNVIEIVVTAENGAVKKYTINVIAGEVLEDVKLDLNGMEYSIINSSNEVDNIPESFTATTVKYDKWDILAYQSPNEQIKVVYLKNSLGDSNWFIYDEANGTFTEYKEYSSKYNRYVILPFYEDLSSYGDYSLTQVTVFGNTVDAYQTKEMKDSDIYIIYAMNLDEEAGYYLFDNVEKTFMRYNIVMPATNTDAVATYTDSTEIQQDNDEEEGFFTKTNMFYMLCGAGGLLLIFLIILIVLGVRIGKLNKELEEADILVAKAEYNSNKNSQEEVKKSTLVKGEEIENKFGFEPLAPKEMLKQYETEDKDEKKTNDGDKDEKKSSVSSIPVVDLGLEDMTEFEEQSKEINDMINEGYDADKDSAFAESSVEEETTADKE